MKKGYNNKIHNKNNKSTNYNFKNTKTNLKNYLIAAGTALFITTGSTVLAASGDLNATVDVTPPWGRIKIIGATQVNNVNYVSRTEIEVEVYTNDDICAENEIKFYLSTDEIKNTEIIPEDKWENYTPGLRKKITLPNVSSMNIIYAAFKDKTGNTTVIHQGENTQYNVVYNANVTDGSVTMPTGMGTIGYYGMPFTVTTQTPEREGYYLLGWSTSPNATSASYYRGSIIPADVFTGTDKTVNLYAVWVVNKEDLPLLSNVVSIGDYVNYPVYYENINTGISRKGWRVISKDIDLDGNESIGTVNLVSAGIPLTFHIGSWQGSIGSSAITTDFFATEFSLTENIKYRKTGFSPNLKLIENFTNKYTEINEGVPKVRSMVPEDVIRITGDTEIKENLNLRDGKYLGLFELWGVYYYLASANGAGMWGVSHSGMVLEAIYGENGVRPVVSLKSNVRAAGTDMTGAWEIEI